MGVIVANWLIMKVAGVERYYDSDEGQQYLAIVHRLVDQ